MIGLGNVDAGTLVDVVIGLTVAEGLVLVGWHRATGRGLAPREHLPNLLAGLALMGALRSALSDTALPWTTGWLMLAGLAHWADLGNRWRRR